MSRSRSPSPAPEAQRERTRSKSRSYSRSPSRSRSRSARRDEPRRDERREDDSYRREDRRDDDSYRREDRRDDDRRERGSSSKSSTSVLVRKLSYRTSTEELKKPFLEFGEVTDVYIPLDFNTRRPRGFGFVKFANPEDADAAIRAMDGAEIDGARVEVVLAQESRKSPRTMRKSSDRYGGRGGRRDRYDDRRGGYGYGDRRRSRSRSYSRDRYERRDRRY